jgi:hypothetical protein
VAAGEVAGFRKDPDQQWRASRAAILKFKRTLETSS